MDNVGSLFGYIIFGIYKTLSDVIRETVAILRVMVPRQMVHNPDMMDENNGSSEESRSVNVDDDSDNNIPQDHGQEVLYYKKKAMGNYIDYLYSLDQDALEEENKKWNDGTHRCLKNYSPEEVNQFLLKCNDDDSLEDEEFNKWCIVKRESKKLEMLESKK